MPAIMESVNTGFGESSHPNEPRLRQNVTKLVILVCTITAKIASYNHNEYDAKQTDDANTVVVNCACGTRTTLAHPVNAVSLEQWFDWCVLNSL